MANYQRLVESFLIAYQPTLKAELEREGALPAYLEEQAEAMQRTKSQILAEMKERAPESSPLQLEMEAERAVIEMFLTPL